MRAAIGRITERRDRVDDPHRYLLNDDPREVLAYLRKHSRGMPEDIRKADVDDGLVLRVWLWWEGETAELWLLDRAEDLGMNRRRVGARLGVTTGQGLVDRRAHKREVLAGAAGAAPAAPTPGRERQDWLDAHRREIQTIARTLVEHWDLADDDAAEWLVEVRRDLADDACTPGAFTCINWAVDAMAAIPAVNDLPTTHPLKQAIGAWPPLSVAYPGA